MEQGTFTPLVFTTTGGMGEECMRYRNRLAELVAAKKGEDYATTVSWIHSKVSFATLKSALLCLRGSRTAKRTIRTTIRTIIIIIIIIIIIAKIVLSQSIHINIYITTIRILLIYKKIFNAVILGR